MWGDYEDLTCYMNIMKEMKREAFFNHTIMGDGNRIAYKKKQ